MNPGNYITLLDPSLQNNDGSPSENLGDLIIYDAVNTILTKLFPQKKIIRISTHVPFTKNEINIINKSLFTFVGGTNILTSDIRNFPRLTPVKKKGFYLFPGFKNVILFGTGWSSYQPSIDWATKIYYKRILHASVFHSIRDIYSLKHLTEAGFSNTLHTSCPTTWNLNTAFVNSYNSSYKKILLMLNSYYPNQEEDNILLETILQASVDKIYFFPQTKSDTLYLDGLPTFKKNKSKITLLNHTISDYYNLLASTKINYIGNRLHGGIKCLDKNNPAMILSVDNRAFEMGKSINLNVIERNNMAKVKKWIANEYIPAQIVLPIDNINKWMTQFK